MATATEDECDKSTTIFNKMHIKQHANLIRNSLPKRSMPKPLPADHTGPVCRVRGGDNFEEEMAARTLEMWEQEEFADMEVITADEGLVIKAHKMIVLTTCPALAPLLRPDKRTLVLTRWSYECVKKVFHFIYAGQTNLNTETALEIVRFARDINLVSLRDEAIAWMKVKGIPLTEQTLAWTDASAKRTSSTFQFFWGKRKNLPVFCANKGQVFESELQLELSNKNSIASSCLHVTTESIFLGLNLYYDPVLNRDFIAELYEYNIRTGQWGKYPELADCSIVTMGMLDKVLFAFNRTHMLWLNMQETRGSNWKQQDLKLVNAECQFVPHMSTSQLRIGNEDRLILVHSYPDFRETTLCIFVIDKTASQRLLAQKTLPKCLAVMATFEADNKYHLVMRGYNTRDFSQLAVFHPDTNNIKCFPLEFGIQPPGNRNMVMVHACAERAIFMVDNPLEKMMRERWNYILPERKWQKLDPINFEWYKIGQIREWSKLALC